MLTRRHFVGGGLTTIAFAGLAHRSLAAATAETYRNEVFGYGPLRRDPERLLDLPEGFSHRVVSRAGEIMDDGFITPDKFDGMGCFRLDGGRLALVRNHELDPDELELGPTGGNRRLENRLRAEPHFSVDGKERPLPGGTSTIIYDLGSGRREAQYLSLAGTVGNCSGGTTPWGSWLTCEETDLTPAAGVSNSHGWLFEVPARQRGLVNPVPLTAMGRFRHEAAAVDARTGIVYLTEDRDDSLFYRFIPKEPHRLDRGGRLQALGLRDAPHADTRNWSSPLLQPGSPQQAYWIDLEEVESPNDDLRARGHAAGAALFARGEGIHAGASEYYFTCTSGGSARNGQIMCYVPSRFEGRREEDGAPGVLRLFVESRDPLVMDYADNLTIAPTGHLIVCEDRTGGEPNHLKGITPQGQVYTLARMQLDTELAGACFSPDGSTLFVNAYAPGRTLAITGPWASVMTDRT